MTRTDPAALLLAARRALPLATPGQLAELAAGLGAERLRRLDAGPVWVAEPGSAMLAPGHLVHLWRGRAGLVAPICAPEHAWSPWLPQGLYELAARDGVRALGRLRCPYCERASASPDVLTGAGLKALAAGPTAPPTAAEIGTAMHRAVERYLEETP